jgi:hypothetical protein
VGAVVIVVIMVSAVEEDEGKEDEVTGREGLKMGLSVKGGESMEGETVGGWGGGVRPHITFSQKTTFTYMSVPLSLYIYIVYIYSI